MVSEARKRPCSMYLSLPFGPNMGPSVMTTLGFKMIKDFADKRVGLKILKIWFGQAIIHVVGESASLLIWKS